MPLITLKWSDVAQIMEQYRDPLLVQYFELVKDLRELSILLQTRYAEIDVSKLLHDMHVCREHLRQENMLQIREIWVQFFADNNVDVQEHLPDFSSRFFLDQGVYQLFLEFFKLGLQEEFEEATRKMGLPFFQEMIFPCRHRQNEKFCHMERTLDEINNELKILESSDVKLLSWFVGLYACHPQNNILSSSRHELLSVAAALDARRDDIDLSSLYYRSLFDLAEYCLSTEALVEQMAKGALAKFSLSVLDILSRACSQIKGLEISPNVALWLEPMIEEAIVVEKQAASSCLPGFIIGAQLKR